MHWRGCQYNRTSKSWKSSRRHSRRASHTGGAHCSARCARQHPRKPMSYASIPTMARMHACFTCVPAWAGSMQPGYCLALLAAWLALGMAGTGHGNHADSSSREHHDLDARACKAFQPAWRAAFSRPSRTACTSGGMKWASMPWHAVYGMHTCLYPPA